MRIIGIDPGLAGALAVLPDCLTFDTPVLGAGRTEYIPVAMAELLSRFQSGSMAIVETQQAYPKQGGVSNFRTGTGFGLWIGILATLGIPYDFVHPATWKRHFSLWGKTKEDSRLLALQLFPQALPQLQRKKDEGRAESLLLAEYCRRKMNG